MLGTMNNTNGVVNLLSAALTPIIAIIAVYIAYQQWKTNKLKVRYELYERRLAVFNAAMKLIAIVIQAGNPEQTQLLDFRAETNESYFLFGRDIYEYLDEMHKKARQLRSIKLKLDRLEKSHAVDEKERSQLIDEDSKVFEWFTNQFEVSRQKFSKYLELQE